MSIQLFIEKYHIFWCKAALFIASYVVLVLVFCPKVILTSIGGALFGVPQGLIVNFIAAMLAAMSGFAIGRYLAAGNILDLKKQSKYRLWRYKFIQHKWATMAVLRLTPLCSFNLLNYILGACVSFRFYCLTTAFFILPSCIFYTLLGFYGKFWFFYLKT